MTSQIRLLRLCGAVLALFVFITPLLCAEEAPKGVAAASSAQDPLVRVLVTKGIITADEARFIGAGNNQHEKLLFLLKDNAELIVAKASGAAFEPVHRYQVSENPTYANPLMLAKGIVVKDSTTLSFLSWD